MNIFILRLLDPAKSNPHITPVQQNSGKDYTYNYKLQLIV